MSAARFNVLPVQRELRNGPKTKEQQIFFKAFVSERENEVSFRFTVELDTTIIHRVKL